MSDKVKLVYLNLVDQDATIITASTEDAFYRASNLKDPRTTKKFRTTATSGNVVFDFITTEAVDTIMVRGDALSGRGFTGTLTVEANATDSWGSPAYTSTLTFSDDNNIGFNVLTSDESYRYWRIVGSGTSYLELSNICIGKSFIPGKNMGNNFSYEQRDLSSSETNAYGQEFFIERNTRDHAKLAFKFLTVAELDSFITMLAATGKTKPIWMIPDNAAFFSPDKYVFSSQFYFKKRPPYRHSIKGLWSLTLDLAEVI